ncbi:MAG: hypothetical protein Kow0047_00930 [Anaerolineae bacterium]
MRRGRAHPLGTGIALVAIGAWMLLRELDVGWPNALLPTLILLAGIAGWLAILVGRRAQPGRVFWATAATLTGALLLAKRAGLLLGDWGALWPLIPAIVGVSAGLEWLWSRERRDALRWSIIGCAVALFGAAEVAGLIPAWALTGARIFWPIILIVLGAGLILSSRGAHSTEG